LTDIREQLKQPLSRRKGISAVRMGLLRKLGVETDGDLLRLFPRAYEDWTNLTRISDLQDDAEQVFIAAVGRVPSLQRKGRLSILRTVLRDDSGSIRSTWFNQPYHQKTLEKGVICLFHGKIKRTRYGLEVTNPTFERLQLPADSPLSPAAVVETFLKPLYPLTAGLTQGVVRSLIGRVLEDYAGRLPETLPAVLRKEWRLCTVDYAYENIHFPKDREHFEVARRRLVFEELFLMQLGLRRLRAFERAGAAAPDLRLTREQSRVFQSVVAQLPFELTRAQKRTLNELIGDLCSTVPMSRLVQGDVGSGKTAVAALALLQCCLSGRQGALMAPTGVLAVQHHHSVENLLAPAGLRIALLTGQTPAAEKRRIIAATEAGEVDILIGTHALLEDRVVFADLGLAVTDEQHRFGVRQRMRLVQTGGTPHVCVMSATPIPRTLGLILYGDLDISLIDELPAGRIPVQTYTAGEADRERVWKLMRKEVEAGHQTYVICPLVKEEDKVLDLRSAESEYELLSQTVFPDLRVGLVYGQMKEKEKQLTMAAFAAGEIDVLVSTTVVEVGVDNPNATFMLIENAERFGLSQLHQLRGRIGRGRARSICVLMSEVTEGVARERMRTLCRTNDGFEIAEADLKLRGPGDFFGIRQHGLPEFKIANLYEDQDLLQESQRAVQAVLSEAYPLQESERRRLQQGLEDQLSPALAQTGL
jgi:ATP-dependent DNA helicase RecG